ncbi:MAG: sulfurtransferase [Candidatus Bipolaricaulia bacterium]
MSSNQDYARPDVLVSTDWVAEHLDDPNVRIAESDEDYLLYEQGHIPNAVKVDWFTILQDPVQRDFIGKAEFEELMSNLGIDNDTTIVFYGDKSNWFACYSFWLFELYGHANKKIMDGGRAKWIEEERPLTKDVPEFPSTDYTAEDPNLDIRAFRDDVFRHLEQNLPLVDVRSPQEYRGELLHMPGYPQEGAMRGGHIPGAANIPWSQATNDDGTFKPADELQRLYEEQGVTGDNDIIAYCRIGERSSHTWFVLKYLLGYDNVKNYDGSWTEWGNLVGAPIEKPEG